VSRRVVVVALVCTAACQPPNDARPGATPPRPEPVVVYASYEDPDFLPGVFAQFTEETGIRVTVRHGEERQNVRDVVEKHGVPPADVLLTRDAFGVWRAADAGALRPLQSAFVTAEVPPALRDADGYWTATGRAEIGVAWSDEERVADRFEDLAAAVDAGRLCLSTSSLAVNRTLVAGLIAAHGVRDAEIIVRGWIAKLALPAFDTEHQLLQAVAAGTCGAGIVSSAAFGRAGVGLQYRVPEPGFAVLEAAGIGRHAHSAEAARALIEWLVSDAGQQALDARPGVYAVHRAAQAALPGVGPPAGSSAGLPAAGLETEAVKLAERARWH